MEQASISVLVADGDATARRNAAAYLLDEGLSVEEAADGEEAIRRIQEKDYDIALIDVALPKVNGLEVLRFVRKTAPLTETIIMGIADVGLAVEAMKFGSRDYLNKPIELGQLIPQIRLVLNRRDAEERIRQLQAAHTTKLLTDLHNPITGLNQSIAYLIKGMAGPLGDHQKELLNYMTGSIDRVVELLNEMMDLAKLEAGRVKLNKGFGNLAQTAGKIIQETKSQVEQNKITVDFHTEPELPPVEYDAEKIEQVVGTLLKNAIRQTPPRGAIVINARKVQLVIEEGKKPADFVMMSVFNSGPGMTKDELSLVFDRFRNVVAPQKDRQYGGLGLVICQRIVDAHQGKIWAESEVSKGSTFSFALPMK
jgi:signal transduction histidine kinase